MERRNSEYALVETQRELESQRQQLLEANQWADQAQRERRHLCIELEMKNRLHQEWYERSCQEIEQLKRRCDQEEIEVRQRKFEENNMQHDQESRTVSFFAGSSSKNYKNDWRLSKTRKSSKILIHRAVVAVPTFRIKLLSPRVPESLAANRESSEIHERI